MDLAYEYLNKYEVIEEKQISDISSQEVLLRHKKSGARVLFILNDDNNKAFYVAFKTLPNNDKGIPHILEHTIFCESGNYKHTNTFSEISKSSLCTFMNAITFSDKTVYPFATCNENEYQKIMDIYLDAVFNANILYTDKYYKQEAWHYELKSQEDILIINGVVYNEMKGRYSSQNRILKNSIYKSLFPETSYRYDAGGNPGEIIKSDYLEVKEFYKKFYHPSNSYIYLYGNIDICKYLKFLDEYYLSRFEAMEAPHILLQKQFDKMNEYDNCYSISKHLNDNNKTVFSLNYAVSTALNRELYQAFDVLDYALVKSAEAPIRQALLETKLCSDILSFYEVGMIQPIYSIIARGMNPENKQMFLKVVENTLQSVVRKGINETTLLAGINKMEFEFRQGHFAKFPKGLYYGMTCLDSWIYDEKQPLLHVECLNTFHFLKKQVKTDYYVRIIENYLLNNDHKSIVTLKPVIGYREQEENKLQKKLEKEKKNLSDEDKNKMIEESATYILTDEESDHSLLSIININQISKHPMHLNNSEYVYKNHRFINHNIETNGIIYVKFMFNMDDYVAEEDILFLKLHSFLFGCFDTERSKNDMLMNEINLYSGGMTNHINIYPNAKDTDKVSVRYEVEIKVYENYLDKILSNLWDIIQNSIYDDIKKLKKLISQIQSRAALQLSKDIQTNTIVRSMANFSKMAYYKELLNGISFYKFIGRVDSQINYNPQGLIEFLKHMNSNIFSSKRLEVSITCNNKLALQAARIICKYLNLLNNGIIKNQQQSFKKFEKKEAFIDELSNYNVAVSGNYSNGNYKYVGYLQILKNILDYDFLFSNIRKAGGAYGNMCSFLRNGDAYFASYLDPNMKRTLDVIHEIPNFIETLKITEKQLSNYKIGVIRNLDFPLTPYAEGNRSMSLLLQNVTYEDIQREREEILLADLHDIRGLSGLVQTVVEQDNLCVIGNEEKIMKFQGLFDRIDKLK